ncbi:MAG: hypothetical protein CMM58_01650 [Rhodospirillaceae bacterium]|nr:hypothetical protein [Rhodospirillaceae bacterium]|tara:strand:- start:236 stop:964 length:729 start_codon:yes stop_codon:yes gene_type:complete
MRIICPDCSAQFDVPDGAIKSDGRKLRCGQCKHEWHQLPVFEDEPGGTSEGELRSDELSLPDRFSVGSDEEFDTPPIPPGEILKYRKNPIWSKIPWVPLSTLFFIVLSSSAFLFWRAEIVSRAPSTALVFDSLGLHVPVKGEDLVLQNVGAWRNNDQFMEILLVQGEIRNPTTKIQLVPIIQGTEVDATGRELQTEYFTPEAATLLPEEVIKFEFQKPFPDENTVKILITFSDQDRGADSGY